MSWKVKSLERRIKKEKPLPYYMFDAEFYSGPVEGEPDMIFHKLVYFPETNILSLPFRWAGRGKKALFFWFHKKHWDSLLEIIRDAHKRIDEMKVPLKDKQSFVLEKPERGI